MSTTDSVSRWLHSLQQGDQDAAQPLWERYYETLVRRAKLHLKNKHAPRRVTDEEDIALSAFDSFCRGAEQGKFPKLHDRHDLWRLLLVITERKALQWAKHERRKKRGGGKVWDEGVFDQPDDSRDEVGGLDQFAGSDPSPDIAMVLAEEFQHLLDMLENKELETIALQKLEGYTCDEIAAKLGCVTRTVERKLHVIRIIWKHEESTEDAETT